MSEFPGLRVLVVEDEAGVAFLIEDMLEELGCEVAASAARLERGFEAAESAEFQLAILDVNVAGEPVFPLARLLRERGIPIVFSTGYGRDGILPEFDRHVVMTKPFSIADMRRAIAAAVGRNS